MKNNEYYYCGKCGAELLTTVIPAEEIIVCDWGDCCRGKYNKYNKITGVRQFGIRKHCPNLRWWNRWHYNANWLDGD